MKKINFFVLLLVFTMSVTTAFAINSEPKNTTENPAIPAKTENKLSEEEVNRLIKRVEEIRDIDKSKLTVTEKRELRNEAKAIKKNLKDNGGYVYIGIGTILLIIIIIILLV